MTDKQEYIKRLDKIQNDLDLLREEVRLLTQHVWNSPKQEILRRGPANPDYLTPTTPPYDLFPSTICPKCGMEWKGVMGYVCMNQPCPIQPSPTCSGGYLNAK